MVNLKLQAGIWSLISFYLLVALSAFQDNPIGQVYLGIVLLFVVVFQSSYTLWTKLIKLFCIVLAIYSLAVTMLVYSLKFRISEKLNQLSQQILVNYQQNSVGLLELAAMPVLVAAMVALLVFFHRASDQDSLEPILAEVVSSEGNWRDYSPSNDETTRYQSQVANRQQSDHELIVLSPIASSHRPVESTLSSSPSRLTVMELLFRVFDAHCSKLALFMIFQLAIADVCLINLSLILLAVVALRFPSITDCICRIATWLISAIIFARTLHESINDKTETCGPFFSRPSGNKFSLLNYIGLYYEGRPIERIGHHLLVLIVLTLVRLVLMISRHRQVDEFELSFGVIFPGVGRHQARTGLVNALKYICNFGFYDFGFEISCFSMIIAISYRLDSVAFSYAVALMLLGVSTNRYRAVLSSAMSALICLAIPVEYLIRLGVPDCKMFPLQLLRYIADKVSFWLFLTDPYTIPNVSRLLLDFLVLLSLSRLAVANKKAKDISNCSSNSPAGEFKSAYLPQFEQSLPGDYFRKQKDLTVGKFVFFLACSITLLPLMAASIRVISFTHGLVLMGFIGLWFASENGKLSSDQLVRNWSWLVCGTSFVITVRTIPPMTLGCRDYRRCDYSWSFNTLECRILKIPTEVNFCFLDIMCSGVVLILLLLVQKLLRGDYHFYVEAELEAEKILIDEMSKVVPLIYTEEAENGSLLEKRVIDGCLERLTELGFESRELGSLSNQNVRTREQQSFSPSEIVEHLEARSDHPTSASGGRRTVDQVTSGAAADQKPPTDGFKVSDILSSVADLLDSTSRIYRKKMLRKSYLRSRLYLEEGRIKLGSDRDSTSSDLADSAREQENARSSRPSSIDGRRSPSSRAREKDVLGRFCCSLIDAILSNTSFICQLLIMIRPLFEGHIGHLVLPALTFFWGALTVPNPSRRFWMVILSYTGSTIMLKYFYLLATSVVGSHPKIEEFFWYFFPDGKISLAVNAERNPTLYWLVKAMEAQSGHMAVNNWTELPFSLATMIYDITLFLVLLLNKWTLDYSGEWSSKIKPPVDESRQGQSASQARGTTLLTDTDARCEVVVMVANCLFKPVFSFFNLILENPFRRKIDVYSQMLLCNLIASTLFTPFIWVFESGVSKTKRLGDVLSGKIVPVSVLTLLLAQFIAVVLDRALYLQKNIKGKLVHYLTSVVIVHYWFFFANDFQRGNWSFKALYASQCLYFLLSALQIRRGYSERYTKNYSNQGFNLVILATFKLYRSLPLVYELRLYVDWLWSKTSLSSRKWSILEDIRADLFKRKCELTIDARHLDNGGTAHRYLSAGSWIILISAVIWAPLFLASSAESLSKSNPPIEVEYQLEFLGFPPILHLKSQRITQIDEDQYIRLKNYFGTDYSRKFLIGFSREDISVVEFDNHSDTVWDISPTSKRNLIDRLDGNQSLIMRASWTIKRANKEGFQEYSTDVGGAYDEKINGDDQWGRYQAYRNHLKREINGSGDLHPTVDLSRMEVPEMFPYFIKAPNAGQASLIDRDEPIKDPAPLSELELGLFQSPNGTVSWWKIKERYLPGNLYPVTGRRIATIIFSDRLIKGYLAILGYYTGAVWAISRLFRTRPAKVMIFTELPCVDRLYNLVMDIYTAGELGLAELEEKLFAKLSLIYRSPELLIEWTKRDNGHQDLSGVDH